MNNLQKVLGNIMIVLGVLILIYSAIYLLASFVVILGVSVLVYFIPGLLFRKPGVSKVLSVILFVVSILMLFIIPTQIHSEMGMGILLYGFLALVIYIPSYIVLLIEALTSKKIKSPDNNNSAL